MLLWPEFNSQENISPSNFDGQLRKILFTFLCLCVRVLRVVAVAYCKGRSVLLPSLIEL